MSYFNNTNFERISEEAHGDISSFPTHEIQTLLDLGLDTLYDDLFLSDFSVSGECDLAQLSGKIKDNI